VACHQRTSTDERHKPFVSQSVIDQEAGATLFAQQCATCHGEDGTTPVGDEETVTNAETYWSTHDDADILKDIGIEPHGEMAGFAQDYGGPLSWEEILDLTAFIRSWGPLAAPVGTPGPTYATTIGPLLTERCGACHGAAAGLSVADYSALMASSSAGPVIVPGDPDGSSIVEVLQGEHYAQLSEAELNLLIEWIANGAPESTGVEEATLPPEPPHPVSLIGAHQGATCEACHAEGEQAPEYVCTNCHQPPENHLQEACDTCHTPEGWSESAASVAAQAPQIPHTLDGRDDCLLCHDPAGRIKPAPDNHADFANEQCALCHKPAP
jgi:mono/diheme cytochrome c family protein